jgi:hypothetical protein
MSIMTAKLRIADLEPIATSIAVLSHLPDSDGPSVLRAVRYAKRPTGNVACTTTSVNADPARNYAAHFTLPEQKFRSSQDSDSFTFGSATPDIDNGIRRGT